MSIRDNGKTIVFRCMECAGIYGCDAPTEKGSRSCSDCPKKYSCVHRVVIMDMESLSKDQRDCETCPEKVNCIRWRKNTKKDCSVCENRDKCKHRFMISLSDDSVDVSHGYCSEECSLLGNPNSSLEDTIRKVLANLPDEEIEELLLLLQSLSRASKLIAPEKEFGVISEVTVVKKMLLRRLIAEAKKSPIRALRSLI